MNIRVNDPSLIKAADFDRRVMQGLLKDLVRIRVAPALRFSIRRQFSGCFPN
jgi:hypothetical protein